MHNPAELSAFTDAALAYCKDGTDAQARRLLRSPYSGVRQEVALAILRFAGPKQSVFEAISSGRVSLPPQDRDSLFAFAQRLRTCGAAAAGASDESLSQAIAEQFGLVGQVRTDAAPVAVHFREAATPEAGMPLRSRHSHFSASSLNTYVECKRKWFYRYSCAAIEDKGSSASFYGTAFHAALEKLHQEYPRPSEVSVPTLRTKLEAYLNAAFDRYASGFDTPIELELQRRRAKRTSVRYVDWLAAQAARAPFTVIGCELPAELALEGYDFIGYIDRLDRDDATGNVTVIDYKTGAIAQTADEYREKVRQFKEFQLPFYYWARTAAGDRVSRLALVPLKDALLEVSPVTLEVVPVASEGANRKGATVGTIPIVELERARTRMIEICAELTGGTIERFEETDDPSACRYCAYANACNGRPWPAEERFGR